jgi:aminoglycoside phosphotransferase (APT) family kinase protein
MTSETRAVKAGEELDVEALTSFVSSEFPNSVGALTIEQFPAGSSNLTYLIKAGDEEFVLRRPPFGNTVKTAHDMRREFEALTKLSAVYAPAPKPLAFCDDTAVIGSEFYLMERRSGLIIRGEISRSGQPVCTSLAERLENSDDYQVEVCKSFIDNLAALHALDYQAAGLGDLGKPEGYARRQVEGWMKRYFDAKTDEWAELEEAIAWLNTNIPTQSGASLVHNDYKFDNVMLDPEDLTRIVAVLDWEMVTVGDPLMDLGTTLGYWIGREGGDAILKMPFNPRVLRENISRRQLVDMYTEASGRDISNILYYYVFGLFKIAAIAQQIYARYVKGFTHDERFAHFDKFVSSLGDIAAHSIEVDRI